MDPQVRTRWTFDGLIEILVDVTTAAEILGSLRHGSPVWNALAHTLATKKESP